MRTCVLQSGRSFQAMAYGTVQEVEEIRARTVEMPPEGQSAGKIRRSQKLVPIFPGQLRLVAAGACIPAQSKERH